MHPLAFYQKRTHLCVLARGRAMFAHIKDMTPARFDILYVMYKLRGPFMGRMKPFLCAQTRITELLGLSRQTIWKAIERLAELGWLTKRKGTFGARRIALELTDLGILRIRQALNAAFSERLPLPVDAPAVEEPARYWRRPELADPPEPGAEPGANCETLGREVERTYSAFVWKRIARRGRRTGRRGKRYHHLARIDELINDGRALAAAFGNQAASIYTLRFSEQLDH